MGQCQQCQQTLLSDTVNCPSGNGEAALDDTEGEGDLVVSREGKYSADLQDNGLLAVWKWDEKPGEGRPKGFQDFETESPWGPPKQNGPATLVLARHLLFNPHLRYKFSGCYRSERKVGAGTYGDVYEATAIPSRATPNREVGGEDDAPARRVAVKAFMVEAQPPEEADRQKLCEFARRRASFEAERSVLAQIEHPHIVKMHECFEEKGYLYIVLELCRGGELYERIAQKVMAQGGRGFEEGLARHLFRQMLYGVGYLHANRVVHRDIKTENFLLLGEAGSDDADVLKLCDFGTAVRLSSQRLRSNGRVGTLSYMAPEVYANKGADICADVWSLGVVLYLILVGANPFRNSQTKTKVATVRKIESGDFDQGRVAWLELTEDARGLIKSLLVLEEEKRLTCVQALRHHWMERQEGEVSAIVPRAAAMGTPRPGSDQDPAAHASSVLMLLMRFAALDPMQKVVLAACSQTLSDNDLAISPKSIPWYSLFVMLDADGDGRINFQEFASGFKTMLGTESVPDEKLYALARALDTDGSGAIEWGEWLAVGLLTIDRLAEVPEPLGTAFRLLDRPTGDGTVGAADLLALIDGGTASGENRVPAEAARAQVLTALSSWAPKPESDREITGVAMLSPPSLVEDDIRRVFRSIGTR
jgi:serine/threonine protein kinase/Ca2+-binding EF-hand superfamily protein